MRKWGVKSTDNQLQAREHWRLSRQHAHMNGILSCHDCTSITVQSRATKTNRYISYSTSTLFLGVSSSCVRDNSGHCYDFSSLILPNMKARNGSLDKSDQPVVQRTPN